MKTFSKTKEIVTKVRCIILKRRAMTSLWKGVCFQMRRRRKSRCGENFRPVTSKPQLVHRSEVDSATIQQTLYFSGGGNFRCILFQRHVWSVCPQSTQLKTMQRTASVSLMSSIIRPALSLKLEEKDNESTNERELRAFFFGQL